MRMRFPMSLGVVVSLMGIVALIVSACGGADPTSTPVPTAPPAPTATPEPAPTATPEPSFRMGGFLVAPNNAAPETWDPHAGGGTTEATASSPLYNQIVEYNPETAERSDLRGDVAEEWQVTADGTSIVFNLRDDARWWNGVPITAEDVVWSLDRMTDPEASRPRAGQFREYYSSSQVIDNTTVQMNMAFPSASAVFYLAIDYMKVLPKGHASTVDINTPENVLGSGPFKLREYKTDISYAFERNEDYWKEGYPRLDGFEYIIMNESATIIAAFKTGRVHTSLQSTTGLSGRDDATLAQQLEARGTHTGYPTVSPSTLGIKYNYKREPFTDPRVRKAIDLAIHRQQVIRTNTPAEALAPLSTPMMPGFWFSKSPEEVAQLPGYRQTADGDKHPDDIAEAQRLLTEAGLYPSGFKTTVKVRNILDWPQAVEVIKPQLKEFLNIDVEIIAGESRAIKADFAAGNYDMNYDGYGYLVVEPDAMLRVWRPAPFGYKNDTNWSHPRIEAWAAQQRQEQDQAKRRAIVQEAEDWLLSFEDNIYSPVYTLTLMWIMDNRVQNFNLPNGDHDGLKWEHIWLDEG
jgi:peptide/nickel transport system substrate-binding protein